MGKAGGHGLAWEEEVVNSKGDNEWVTVTLLRGGKEIIYGSLRGCRKVNLFQGIHGGGQAYGQWVGGCQFQLFLRFGKFDNGGV